MKTNTKILTVLALVLALALVPLAACGGGSGDAEGGAAPAAASGEIDTSGWKTVADALEVADNLPSWSSDGESIAMIFTSGDRYIRVVSTYTEAEGQEMFDLDSESPDYIEQLKGIIGDWTIKSAADVTSDRLDQATLDQYVGKTGQDMIDDGFVFNYYMGYGGEATYAFMDKGNFSYDVTFDATVSEDQTEDGGEAILDAAITEIMPVGVSDLALDPTNL